MDHEEGSVREVRDLRRSESGWFTGSKSSYEMYLMESSGPVESEGESWAGPKVPF